MVPISQREGKVVIGKCVSALHATPKASPHNVIGPTVKPGESSHKLLNRVSAAASDQDIHPNSTVRVRVMMHRN